MVLFFCSKYVKEHAESDSFRHFAGKVFMSQNNSIKTLEDCRHQMETMFEANFKPDRDFLDYITIKKERHFEQYFEKTAENAKKKKE